MDSPTWKKEKLIRLRDEATRLIEAIDRANNDYDLNLYSSRRMAAVKRQSLALNDVAVVIRKGFYADQTTS